MTLMMMRVAGDWTASRTPQLLIDYPHPLIERCDDVTGENPVGSLGVWDAYADSSVVANIEADSRYLVLWAEEVTNGIP